MKKFNLSLVAVLAMSTFVIAGGDIAPVEPVIEEPIVEAVSDAGFYLGLGYGWTSLETTDNNFNPSITDSAKMGSIMIDAGYKFNQYIAVEGRYWFGLGDSNALGWTGGVPGDVTVDSWGIYVKPMYPVTDAFDIYALLGYGGSDITIDNVSGRNFEADGFSWGLGAAYDVTENVSVFLDYTEVINNDDIKFGGLPTNIDFSTDVVTFGVNYKF